MKSQALGGIGIHFRAIRQSVVMLNPVSLIRNPVMFTVEVGALLTTFFAVSDALHHGGQALFASVISFWLWLTILFANYAESLAEQRGKAQAESLRTTRSTVLARLVTHDGVRTVAGSSLKKWDLFLLSAGDIVPTDGEILEGAASVDESAITGESAPVIREADGDRSGVTGGTRVLAGELRVRVTANPGETFLDRMISLVEGATRQKSPNEIALTILLVGLTLIFLFVVATIPAFSAYSKITSSPTVLIALLVCLIPTTIAGLLPAIGIAGIDRAFRANVIAKSGKAVEMAGDIDLLLLDKTGTITFGNRQAVQLIPAPGVSLGELARACRLASLFDKTPEGKSTLALSESLQQGPSPIPEGLEAVAFTPQSRMSGADTPEGAFRKGSDDAMESFIGHSLPPDIKNAVSEIAESGGTPLVVSRDKTVLGLIHLKDVIKPGLLKRFERLRRMGVATVMVTGDNPLTARAIAREAGIDDFFAQAKPEDKMELIKKEQAKGRLVAMSGDGTNDAPSLAQADVALAMNSGTQAAKEAGNMVDLDSDPTKIIEVIEIGKQLLMTRGALTTFSIANDVAKYFAILPAMFIAAYPQLGVLNVMRLATPVSAVTSAIIFNALIIPALIPLALRGVRYRPLGASALLRNNLLIYGLGGILVPFLGIKLIDMVLVTLHLT
ncbi:MAG: potassium-transporting ATPase subunit KdpB [Nitrospiraceae bacterium]|nr:potassium-transporting ATPase subunit KdpB [Nitrospiraceae bacterium]